LFYKVFCIIVEHIWIWRTSSSSFYIWW